MSFVKTCIVGYLGSAAGCLLLLIASSFWEKSGTSIVEVIPAAFTLQVTIGLPWMLGAFVAIWYFNKRGSK